MIQSPYYHFATESGTRWFILIYMTKPTALPLGFNPIKIINQTIEFFREVKAELSKVIWPNREQTIKLTAIVVGVSLLLGFYIGLLDLGFTKLVNLFLIR